ncbi:hypothetical protein PSAB_02370 [Paenibacillus sabinae T27]|uniref:Uncharacterized protein n=1 Tax=Paenibacillus sabinae T27 TaxID=1268072 RepID=X4ZF89_9BACL|nr:hypothetical protein PSAB_02370 [Paenibacillus sabinae T27]
MDHTLWVKKPALRPVWEGAKTKTAMSLTLSAAVGAIAGFLPGVRLGNCRIEQSARLSQKSSQMT